MIQTYESSVSLVKYDDFDKKQDEGSASYLGEEVGDFFQDFFGNFDPRNAERKMHKAFNHEIPKFMHKMADMGTKFGRMGEEMSRRFHERPRPEEERSPEVVMILDLLKSGKITAEEAEKLIHAIQQRS